MSRESLRQGGPVNELKPVRAMDGSRRERRERMNIVDEQGDPLKAGASNRDLPIVPARMGVRVARGGDSQMLQASSGMESTEDQCSVGRRQRRFFGPAEAGYPSW